MQTIRTDNGIGKVWIADGRLNIRVAHYLPNDSHCCASQHTDLSYASRKSRLSIASQVTASNAAPLVDPLAASASTNGATAVVPPNPTQHVRLPRGSGTECEGDSISSKSDDGAVLTMLSGASYHVSAVDRVDSAIWLATEDVVICDEDGVYKITNKDDNGETVEATKIAD